MYDAQERGRFIINSLKLACLLEGSLDERTSYEEDHVKMHDVLRDMAHWLAREHGSEILVKEHSGLIKSQEIGRWKETIRVSLYGDSTEFLIETPVVCPRLKTIFVMGSTLTTLPDQMETEYVVIPPGVISSLSSLEMYSNLEYFSQCKIDMKLIIEEFGMFGKDN
ncbi:hypothetical protein LWI29_021879 [Acer saccharum]|uniref:Uncharacterized protein n=1 Tax=Acer saccharum TaxID=4024 RepID=A0AA39SWN0_ACESA|nr:hypothetical protein LWI29_021879 [Acer saccharum]